MSNAEAVLSSLFGTFLNSKDKVKCMRIKANNDLGHRSRSRISNMETESQKQTEVSANRSAAAEADQLPDVSQGDQMFQQKTSNNTWSCITDNKRCGSSKGVGMSLTLWGTHIT